MKNKMNIPFYQHYIGKEEQDAVARVLDSGWINTGPETAAFENDLKKVTGADHVVALNSATAGLFLALKLFGVKEGDEVITTPLTYAASANVIFQCGACPVFADIGPDGNISPAAVASLITRRTKAIIPVDLGGLPCDYDHLYQALAHKKDLFKAESPFQERLKRPLLLSDSAHSFGAFYKSKAAGTLADISVFSFHVVKNITTADGGAVCFRKDVFPQAGELEQNFRQLSLHGQTKSAYSKVQEGAWRYDIVFPGYKFNMTDMAAALGRVQLKRNDYFLKKRVAQTDVYDRSFRDYPDLRLRNYDHKLKASAHHLYMLELKGVSAVERDRLISLAALDGAALNVHYLPVPLFSFYAARGYNMDKLPAARRFSDTEISLPLYPSLKPEAQQYVIDVFLKRGRELQLSCFSS